MASITKLKSGWRVRVSNKGKVYSKSGFPTKRDAQLWAMKTETELQNKEDGAIPNFLLKKALQRYLEEVVPTKKGSRLETTRIKAWLGKGKSKQEDPLALISLQRLNESHIADWRDRRLKEVQAGTVLREWNLLSAIFSKCVKEWRWLKSNPMTNVLRPPEPVPRTRRPTPEEIEALLIVTGYEENVPPDSKTKRVGAAMLFAIETAMRAGEICGLTWNNVNFEKKTAFLPTTKNGSSRTVPLSKKAVSILKDLEGLEECQANCFGMTSSLLDAMFRKSKVKANIEDLHFHDMRREALTRMSKKVEVLPLAKISGHKDLKLLLNVYYSPEMSEYSSLLD